MNKKGKNKKGKVPNPILSQEEKPGDEFQDLIVTGDKGAEEKTIETIENVDVKEERVPEIVSEVIAVPAETKDEETPKKPKRNRGKKKKGKEDDSEDIVEEGPKESTVQPAVVEEIKTDVQKVEKESSDVPIVTPTVRKKKNKKKNVDQKPEEAVLPEVEPDPIVPKTKDVIIEPELSEIKQEITPQPETAEQEIKPSKKKNKKKKRNDSERSEKEEISCTSAFQKLMDVKDEELKIEDKNIDNVNIVESVKLESEVQLQTNEVLQEAVVEKDITGSDEAKNEESSLLPIPENKNKKKNKKDKKHIPKSEDNVVIPDEPAPTIEPILSSENIIKQDVSKDTLAVKEPEPLVEETSPKPKAKIAKPVEKKRKGKQDALAADSLLQDTSITEAIKLEEQTSQGKNETPETKITETQTISDIDLKNIEQRLPIDDGSQKIVVSDPLKGLNLQEFESLNVPDKAMGKKRKKGLKVSKTPDVSFEVLESKTEVDEAVDVSKHLSEATTVDKNVITKEQITSETKNEPIPSDTQTESKPIVEPVTQSEIKDHILLTPDILPEKDNAKIESLVPEKVEDILKFETKPGKKRKKQSKKIEEAYKADEPVLIASTSTKEDVPKVEVTKEMGDKIDASNITRMYDIEISSIKADESEGSVCDTIPDITYPRSSSQQLLDDNNNSTTIREVFPVQEIIPDAFLQECIKPPKANDSNITEAKKDTSPFKEEKTDLKSKMMEVNQDMEELRLSIERSLAELTAIEKTEEAAEKQCVNPPIQCIVPSKEAQSKVVELDVVKEKDTEIDVDKSLGKVQYCKDFDDLFFSICFDKQRIKSDNIHDEIKPTNLNAAIVTDPTSDDKAKPMTIEEVKKTEPTDTTADSSIETKIDSVIPKTIELRPSESLTSTDVAKEKKLLTEQENIVVPSSTDMHFAETEQKLELVAKKDTETKSKPEETHHDTPPTCPTRKDNKGKHKKKKGKQDTQTTSQPVQSTQSATSSQSSTSATTQEAKPEEKSDAKSETKDDSKDNKKAGKQQASNIDSETEKDLFPDTDYEPIENFEDALTSSVDDVNKTFELIVQESQEQSNPKINIIAPDEEKKPVSPSKNLLGHPDIPVPSNKRDYKKEKDKIPNEITAKVKIKDAVDVEKKPSKNTQTINKLKDLKDCKLSENEEFVYKYSFRKVFLQSSCHVCKKELAGTRVACCYCNLVFYCGIKHKDEDWPVHQAFCFAVSTIGHLKDQKHIYADAKNITGQDYRLVRMQMIVSCEKILKRRLVPWEQEALLYPRMCAYVPCREWRQMKLTDCQGCGQISFCTEYPDHYPKSHSRWCKPYSLYQKLVCYQQTKGRLEPKLPTKVMQEQYEMPEKINEVLAGMYEEKIDMNDIQYAALTQLATAPLTTAYCYQLFKSKNSTTNGYKKAIFTVHVVGAELQFEADALNKWEVFLLHLRPDLQELRVVLINYNLNPSNLPLELLGKIKLCEQCRQDKRRVVLRLQDKITYAEYKSSDDFIVPDIVCAFNPSIQRSSAYNGKDPWPSTINAILKMKIPFLITGYTITELHKDCIRIKECSETGYTFICEPKNNSFASVRPDRNFISDDEVPLLFKNYCFAIICGN